MAVNRMTLSSNNVTRSAIKTTLAKALNCPRLPSGGCIKGEFTRIPNEGTCEYPVTTVISHGYTYEIRIVPIGHQYE